MVLADPMDQWDTTSPHILVAMVFLALQLYTKSINQGGGEGHEPLTALDQNHR